MRNDTERRERAEREEKEAADELIEFVKLYYWLTHSGTETLNDRTKEYIKFTFNC